MNTTIKTRMEHHKAAEAVAANNKDWTWDGRHLLHKSGALVRLAGYGSRWGAWPPAGPRLRGREGRLLAYKSPAAAIRALGFSVKVAPEGG